MRKAIPIALVLLFLVSSCLLSMPVKASSALENTWATKAHIPQAADGCKAATVDGKIYVIGGSQNYQYDPATDNWTVKAPMPTPRDFFGIAVYQNRIFTIGGYSRNGGNPIYALSTNEVYDPSTNTWETKSPLPTGRQYIQASVVNGEIYVIGGRTGGIKTTTAVNEVYNVENDSWTTKAAIPYGVLGYASAVCGGRVYVFGGLDEFLGPSSANVDFTQIYDPMNDSWSMGKPMPTLAEYAGAAATTGELAEERIYLIGGMGISNEHPFVRDTVQVYDPENDTWNYGKPMPTARMWLTIAVVNDMLYVFSRYPICTNEQYFPLGYGSIPPKISILYPTNCTITNTSFLLQFVSNKQIQLSSYSLDGQLNVSIAGNTTLTGLSSGTHNITVYVNDNFGNVGKSETVTFGIAKPVEPLPTIVVIAVVLAVVIVVGVGLLYSRHLRGSKLQKS
ncbi:MAG: Kelch repeat-containing protein [Candidatus Bathyarchaeia archaeon]|jgi:N-acetylneuraminic acid mutarotase